MHHVKMCTDVFIIRKRPLQYGEHAPIPPPLPPMLNQRRDGVGCQPFHKKRPLLQFLVVHLACQHWTRGIGGGSLHACLVYAVGVYYENTGTLFQVVHPPHQ